MSFWCQFNMLDEKHPWIVTPRSSTNSMKTNSRAKSPFVDSKPKFLLIDYELEFSLFATKSNTPNYAVESSCGCHLRINDDWFRVKICLNIVQTKFYNFVKKHILPFNREIFPNSHFTGILNLCIGNYHFWFGRKTFIIFTRILYLSTKKYLFWFDRDHNFWFIVTQSINFWLRLSFGSSFQKVSFGFSSPFYCSFQPPRNLIQISVVFYLVDVYQSGVSFKFVNINQQHHIVGKAILYFVHTKPPFFDFFGMLLFAFWEPKKESPMEKFLTLWCCWVHNVVFHCLVQVRSTTFWWVPSKCSNFAI